MKGLRFRVWDIERECYLDKTELAGITQDGKYILYIEEEEISKLEIEGDYIVEQYTGLKDKNGKEIYEGDIMIFDACLYKVVWNEEYAGFDYETIGEWGVTSTNVFNDGAVIGNIHENPDLLEE